MVSREEEMAYILQPGVSGYLMSRIELPSTSCIHVHPLSELKLIVKLVQHATITFHHSQGAGNDINWTIQRSMHAASGKSSLSLPQHLQ